MVHDQLTAALLAAAGSISGISEPGVSVQGNEQSSAKLAQLNLHAAVLLSFLYSGRMYVPNSLKLLTLS